MKFLKAGLGDTMQVQSTKRIRSGIFNSSGSTPLATMLLKIIISPATRVNKLTCLILKDRSDIAIMPAYSAVIAI